MPPQPKDVPPVGAPLVDERGFVTREWADWYTALYRSLPRVTVKNGSAGGAYTTTSASYADMDGTNLAATLSVPVGWKAVIEASMFGNNTVQNAGFVSISDGSTDLNEVNFGGASMNAPISLSDVFTGDGASHTFKLRFKASSGTTTIGNASSSQSPVLTVTLIRSN